VGRLRNQGPAGLLKFRHYIGRAWTRWLDGTTLLPDGKGVHVICCAVDAFTKWWIAILRQLFSERERALFQRTPLITLRRQVAGTFAFTRRLLGRWHG
jgi:hypothetical protein